MKIAFVALALSVAVVGPAAAITPLSFKVTLRADLVEHRTYTLRRTAAAGCEETTTGATGSSFRIESTRPSLIRVQRGRVSGTLQHLKGRGGGGSGSYQTPSCTDPGLVEIGDCGFAIWRARRMTAELAPAGTQSIVIRRTRPRLPRSMGCSPALPRTVPRLDLALAEGQISPDRLLNPKLRVTHVFGEYDARIPVELDNGTMTLTRRVHWHLTFTRAS